MILIAVPFLFRGDVLNRKNIWEYGAKRTNGVGGNLFAIASDLLVRVGYEGYVVAEAMDQQLFKYYISEFGALPLPPINSPYRFMLSDVVTSKIREVYGYEWTDEEI